MINLIEKSKTGSGTVGDQLAIAVATTINDGYMDWYTVMQNETMPQYVDFEWSRVKEMLMLLDKIKWKNYY